MLHDSILGVELLLRQFQNIFAWWMKWKNLDYYVNIFFTQIWNFGSLCDHYEMKNTLFDTGFLNRLIYWYWAWKPNFFIIKKIVFFNISNRPNRLNRTAKNRTTIGRKTDPRQCASVPIMKKPISIGSVINLEKNCPYRTAHIPNHCYVQTSVAHIKLKLLYWFHSHCILYTNMGIGSIKWDIQNWDIHVWIF